MTPIKIDQSYNSEHVFSKTLHFQTFLCKFCFIQNILIIIYCIVLYCIIYCIVLYCVIYCIVILNINFKGCKKLSPLLERNRLCSSLSRFLWVPGTLILNHEYNVQCLIFTKMPQIVQKSELRSLLLTTEQYYKPINDIILLICLYAPLFPCTVNSHRELWQIEN